MTKRPIIIKPKKYDGKSHIHGNRTVYIQQTELADDIYDYIFKFLKYDNIHRNLCFFSWKDIYHNPIGPDAIRLNFEIIIEPRKEIIGD